MPNRYIYISDELNERLRQEKSASALISRLLTEHYIEPELEKKKEEEKEKEVAQERERREVIRKNYLEHKGREPTESEYKKDIDYLNRCKGKLPLVIGG